jgi:uncharacterized protein (TIGR04141 family)
MIKLLVRLSKPGKGIDALLKADHGLAGPVNAWGGIPGAMLYYGSSPARPPGWFAFLSSGLPQAIPNLTVQGSVALVFVPVQGRFVVYSFGHTASKLNIAPFERDFGLKVVLNKVDPEKIRSIDSRIVDSVVTNKRTQLSRENKLAGFGFEIDREMLKSLAGKANEENFGSVLSGSDTLSLNCNTTAAGLLQKSNEIVNAYSSTAYQKHFKWIDNIQAVKDEAIIKELNNKMMLQLNRVLAGAAVDTLQLACPEIIDFGGIDGFRVKGYRSRKEFGLPVLSEVIADMAEYGIEEVVFDDLDRYRVEAIQGDETINHWSFVDWLIAEVTHDRKHYILSEGSWFVISRSFYNEVDGAFQALMADATRFADLGNTDRANEEDYLRHYPINNNNIILDRKLFGGYGPKDTIEICDIYEIDGKFVHVKDGASSSKCSHLFNQGYVSAYTLLSDREYRQSLVYKLSTKPGLAATVGDPVVASDHTIAFRMLKDGPGVSLPFFTKVILRDTHKRILAMGFRFRLEWVHKV